MARCVYSLLVIAAVLSSSAHAIVLRGGQTCLRRSQSTFPLLLKSRNEAQMRHNISQELFEMTDMPKKKHQMELHLSRVQELEGDTTRRNLMFYGDSITEQWREQIVGNATKDVMAHTPGKMIIQNTTGNIQTFKAAFERYGPAAVMAVAGDSTGDLLWRLRNGEAPRQQPKAIVLHIGINNLGALGAYCCLNEYAPNDCNRTFGEIDGELIFFSIKAVIQELWQSCQAPIIVSGLFPTGWKWPAGNFGVSVPYVNLLLQELAASSPADLHVLDCSQAVLSDDGTGRIDPAFMPDFLHPSPEGMKRWAQCLTSGLDRVLDKDF